MEFCGTLSSAYEFAQKGMLEEWVHLYLMSDGRNPEFSEGLKKCPRIYHGPVVMPLELFRRCCGPEEGMTYRVDAGGFERKVEELTEAFRMKRDVPPMIAHYVDGEFELNDGNHRFEACVRAGIREYEFILWITESDGEGEFLEKYGKYVK